MSALLVEAVKQLNLRPGQTYRTTVNDCEVELRVLAPPRPAAVPQEASDYADQMMLEPWAEFPRPPAVGTVLAQRGPLPLPDPPIIPPDDGEWA